MGLFGEGFGSGFVYVERGESKGKGRDFFIVKILFYGWIYFCYQVCNFCVVPVGGHLQHFNHCSIS